MTAGWEAVLGLEIHVQLATRSKLFCGCANRFGAEPNTLVCPICLGHPGTLPVLNREAVALAVRLGLALGCEIAETSVFARKNYIYPDLPKGYQISQYEAPICSGGRVPVLREDGELDQVELERIHMEEDAGKNLHDGGASGVDCNRAGTPLCEMVTRPVLRSADEAMDFLRSLRSIVRYLGVSDGNMEQGSLRCDVNVSVRRPGEPLGTKVEVKNVNSFKFVGQAADYEIRRQIALLEAGGRVVQETRGFDSRNKKTLSQRRKETESDYRYFPDPDLPPLVLPEGLLAAESANLPELPHDRQARFETELSLSEYDARVLTAERDLADWFESAVASAGANHAKALANWTMGELMGLANEAGVSLPDGPVAAEGLAELVLRIEDGTLSSKMAKRVASEMWASGERPDPIIERLGLRQITDTAGIDAVVLEVLGANPAEVERYCGGESKLLGFFVGQVMRATRGQADPGLVNERLRALLKDL